MDPCAGLHILAHGSIPLPYLPNLCAVLRPAPLASYYFPFLSFSLLSPCIGLSLGSKGNKNVYFSTIESGNSILKQFQENWPKHLNDKITFETVDMGFKNIKTIAPSVYQHFNNFKHLHGRTVHNKLLSIIGVLETPNCLFCKSETKTIEHIYIECDNVNNLWMVTEDWVRIIYYAHFKRENNNSPAEQLIILSVKDVIYSI